MLRQHSTAPWKIENYSENKFDNDQLVRIRDAEGNIVAEEVQLRDASLIVQAPNLLGALMHAHDFVDDMLVAKEKVEKILSAYELEGKGGLLNLFAEAIQESIKSHLV